MPDILDESVRKLLIKESLSQENKDRKTESLKRFEIYRERQHDFVVNKLKGEFNDQTVKDMRKITSINLTKRIVNDEASIYKAEPERTFIDASDQERDHLMNLYSSAKANVRFKKSNRWFKLFDQGTIQVIPNRKKGIIDMRVLSPHHFDVVPSDEDAEIADAYFLSGFDKHELLSDIKTDPGDTSKLQVSNLNQRLSDGKNQKIADQEDYQKSLMRYVWWSDEWNFETDGNGRLVGEMLPNPIGKLPFIDIAFDKDGEFFVRWGNNVVDFALDFGVLLSDYATILRMQGWAQAIIRSTKEPRNLLLGPQHALWLPIDPDNPDLNADFTFATPNADLAASLEALETYLSLFLSSRGQDPKLISGRSDGAKFTSGIERLLSNLEKFEATLDDFDLFRDAEDQVLELFKLWNNVLQGTVDNPLKPELQGPKLSDKIMVSVEYHEPQVVQTKTEKEDSIIKLEQAGYISRTEGIMELRDLEDEDEAIKVIEKIDKERQNRFKSMIPEDVETQPVEEPIEGNEPPPIKDAGVEGQGVTKVGEEEAISPDQALNGPQVTSLLQVVEQFQLGVISRESAIAVITAAFPISRARAADIVGVKLDGRERDSGSDDREREAEERPDEGKS